MSKTDQRRRHKRICKICGKNFIGCFDQLYCSYTCRQKLSKRVSEFPELSTGTVGAIQEHRVIVDLLGKGYEVFRAASPSCSCDLLFLKDGKPTRVEVKTAYAAKNGNMYYGNATGVKADVLALVLLGGKIHYIPSL